MPYVPIKRESKIVGRLYYEDIGSPEKPVIVMQHGDGNSSQDWHSLGYVDGLKDYRLLLIDYIGYGKSDKVYNPDFYAMPSLAEDTITLLNYLGIQEAIFYGGSMGARLGYEIASTLQYAQYFSLFILNGMRTSENTIIQKFGKWAEEGGMIKVVKEMNAVMAGHFPTKVQNSFLNQDPKAYAAANTKPWPAVKARLSHIDKPVLLICGEIADEREEMEQAQNIIANAELAIIEGADHAQAYWWSQKVLPIMLSYLSNQQIKD